MKMEESRRSRSERTFVRSANDDIVAFRSAKGFERQRPFAERKATIRADAATDLAPARSFRLLSIFGEVGADAGKSLRGSITIGRLAVQRCSTLIGSLWCRVYDWRELVLLSDREFARLDIAAVNLACGVGLPGCDRIDAERCLRTVDDMARRCARFTDQVMPMFRTSLCDYPESEPKFRIQAMISHLQRDIGVRYHPGRKAVTSVFEDVDHFLHGIFLSEGGTCGSMPVLYAAVGRRLGYPIVLTATKEHLLARWDALPGGECFNIDGAGEGISFFPDEHYYQDMPPVTIRSCRYLESQSPRHELAGFLSQRAHCFMDRKDWQEASTAFAWANELCPGVNGHGSGMYSFLTWQTLRVWHEALRRRLPGRMFPKLDLGLPAHYFRELPREIERELIRLRVQQSVMDDPEYERRWWAPMRAYPFTRPRGLPEVLRIDYRWNRPAKRAGQPV